MLAAIESSLPTSPLVYTVDASGSLHKQVAPDIWLIERVAADEIALVCNGDESSPVSLSAAMLPRGFVPKDEQLARLTLEAPYSAPFIERALHLAHTLGPAAAACWGDFSPLGRIAAVIKRFVGSKPIPPPPGAPRYGGILAHTTHPAIPALIGWVNYWSAETCRLVGFSDAGPQSQPFKHVVACEGGGVALQLTEAPLDLENPEHLAALEIAYDAFPAIHRANGS